MCKTCEPMEVERTIGGIVTETRDVLLKTYSMVSEILTMTSGVKPVEVVTKEPSCLMEDLEINLENARIIAGCLNDILHKFRP